ncbi:Long chain acyl-CoA synthetase 7, peroxisomal [Morella rubra]|uniref:Long chain acyl-CoA synthetase 7, peroxisomal n=1 Tax=Morella rubra TaxID=262757 RepID=A0A6A1VL31_9ROSI|nr:Long chain acyl-CoA synthetase 7, peroxisomal [Morella rubra]
MGDTEDVNRKKTVFVTVGTTCFDALVRAMDTREVKDGLLKRGYTHLIIQMGRGSYTPTKSEGEDGSLAVDFFTFSSSIADHLRSASLVISHAGSGSIFETLRLGKPLIVVVNEDLMDNHQKSMKSGLAADGNFLVKKFPPVSRQRYSVVLPEKLQTGRWNVYRYTWMTYGQAGTAREAIGSGLWYYGLREGDCVGLYFINRPEWLIMDHTCSAYSFISVPLYDTLGPDAVQYVVNHAALQAIFCSHNTEQYNIDLNFQFATYLISFSWNLQLLSFLSEIPSLRLIVVVGGIDEYLPSLPSASGVKLISYLELISQLLGASVHIFEISHLSLSAMLLPSETIYSVNPENCKCCISIGNAEGRAIPRRLQLQEASNNGGWNPSPMWDILVFNKIKDKLGGRVRLMASGASPLSPDVMDFLRVCFGCQVIEGYGMTETSSVISIMDEGDTLSSHVGSPNPACEIKLVDVPEMNYISEDQPHPRGEICVRGPIVFQGYYKDEVQTREVLDDDGWLRTGDIGLWLPGGRLKIIDRKDFTTFFSCYWKNSYWHCLRKKNIFKLAQGDYIAPGKDRERDSLNSSLVDVVAVDPNVMKDWASSKDIKYESLSQLSNDPRARAAVLAEMDNVGRKLTSENGLLTPTLKIKRPQAKAYFAKAISDMYAELSNTASKTAQNLMT